MKTTKYKFMPLLVMLYMTLMLTALVLVYKPLAIGSITTTCAGLVSPFNFVLGDIIAEIYGYNISKKILIYALICQFIFCLITTAIIQLPSPSTWHEQHAYDYVMHGFLKIYFSVVVGYFIANISNIYLITKWKALLQGKYFWLRSIGSSGIGELTYSIITAVTIFWGTMSGKELVSYVVMVCLFKFMGTIIFAFPANIITNVLKKIESTEIDKEEISFNPFQHKKAAIIN